MNERVGWIILALLGVFTALILSLPVHAHPVIDVSWEDCKSDYIWDWESQECEDLRIANGWYDEEPDTENIHE